MTTLVTVPEAARRVRRNPETVRRRIRSGRLRAQRVGTQHLIDEADLAAPAEGATVPLPPAWRRSSSGEMLPDVVAILRDSCAGR